MIVFGYLGEELRRRWGRTIVTALDVAAGVGLVMGITVNPPTTNTGCR
jgi:hypothetical protein